MSRDMGLICPSLAAIPAFVAIAAVIGRMVASLAREARLTAVVWLALRGTQPSERPEILKALGAGPHQVEGTMVSEVDSVSRAVKYQGNSRGRAQRLDPKSEARC